MNNSCVAAIILAAGSGTRMNLNTTKQKLLLGSESVLRRTVRIFNECNDVDSIIIATRNDEYSFAQNEAAGFVKVKEIVIGGATRVESARRAFEKVGPATKFVAIHDAARCFVTCDMISAVIKSAKKHGAATASTKVTDTVKKVNSENRVLETVDRNSLMLVQTPQVFSVDLYRTALDSVQCEEKITDDNMLLESIGISPVCVETGKRNIKLTTQEDLIYAKFLLGEECGDV